MNYIGDLSKYDYEVLKNLSLTNHNILEFGIGASTQVLRNFSTGKMTSVETSDFWIDLTKENLNYLKIKKDVNFFLYDEFDAKLEEYDFIFNDGIDTLRNEFGIKIWKNLKIGGIIAYHDTRRIKDIQNVINLLNNYKDEIENVSFNYENSNITIIKKKEKNDVIFDTNIDVQSLLKQSPYYDWNDIEKKIRLKYGISMNQGFEIPKHLEL